MKALTLAAAMVIAMGVSTTMVVTEAVAYKGGSSNGYGKGCSKSPPAMSRSHTVRSPMVARSREGGADANFGQGAGSTTMPPNNHRR